VVDTMSHQRPARIRGPRDFGRLSSRSREAFLNAAEVVSEARRRNTTIDEEIRRAQQRELRVSRYTVRRYFGHDLERGPRGALVPKKADRSYHGDLRIISTKGLAERAVRGSNARRTVSEHANAVQRYLNGDDADGEGLEQFADRRVGGVELETDRDRLDELQRRGEFDDFDLYADRGA
jgi:hypothetical protein